MNTECPAGRRFVGEIEFLNFDRCEQRNQNIHCLTAKRTDLILQPIAATRAGHDS